MRACVRACLSINFSLSPGKIYALYISKQFRLS